MDEDPLLPAAPALLGDDASEIVGVAVEYAGGRLRDLTAKSVQYRPGRSLAVVYDARVQWPKRGRTTTEGIVAMTTVDGAPEGSLPLECDGLDVGVWRVRNDPMLPGLEYALSAPGARMLLGGARGPVSIALRAYRPTRRAVVALTGDERRFAKVVRPANARAIASNHERFRGVVPAPDVVATDSARGIVTLRAVAGRSVLDALVANDQLPNGSQILDLVERIATVPCDATNQVRSARRDARSHARLLVSTLPDIASRVDRLLDAIGEDSSAAPTTIHGDLYEAQLFVIDGEITGVLDLDRAGPGHIADDLATVLAHLGALGIHRPPLAAVAAAYADRLWNDFSAATDSDDLKQRVAAVVVGLATTPFRHRRADWQAETGRYLDLAARWIDDAHVAETNHIPAPGGQV